MLPIEKPFQVFTGRDGLPLNNGYIYFGTADQNPETSPKTVYWDAAGTQPAAQPIRTENGYIVRSGTPANVFVDTTYSMQVKDSKKRQVFYVKNSDSFSPASLFLPLTGGNLSGSLILDNNKGFFIKDTSAVARQIALLDSSNNLNLTVAGGTELAVYNQSTSVKLLSITNAGALTLKGNALPPTNNSAAFTADGGFGGGYKMVDGGTQVLTWLETGIWQWGFGSGGAFTSKMSLTSAGVATATTFTGTSDERKKFKWEKLPADFLDRLAAITKSGIFHWKKGKARDVGVGAQSLEAILPEAVYTDERGIKSVNYGSAALVAVIELAREVKQLRLKLAKLEAK